LQVLTANKQGAVSFVEHEVMNLASPCFKVSTEKLTIKLIDQKPNHELSQFLFFHHMHEMKFSKDCFIFLHLVRVRLFFILFFYLLCYHFVF